MMAAADAIVTRAISSGCVIRRFMEYSPENTYVTINKPETANVSQI